MNEMELCVAGQTDLRLASSAQGRHKSYSMLACWQAGGRQDGLEISSAYSF